MVYSRKKVTTTPKRRLVPSRQRPIALVVVAILIIGGLIFFYVKNNDSSDASSSTTPAAEPRPTTDKASTGNPASPADTSPNKQVDAPNPTTPAPTPAAVAVTKPSGTFVSNHKPGQNGSPLTESSVCNTTPQINCAITFTKDGVTKSLPAKVTDTSGAAYWDWSPQSIGLTSGNWIVSASASSGQQTETTQDPIVLQIL